MQKCIITILILLLLQVSSMCIEAGQVKYTAGGHFFAPSEQILRRVISYQKGGNYRALESMSQMGLVLVPVQGLPVEIYSVRGVIYKVRFPAARTIWWTTKDALMNRGGERYVK